MMFSWKQIHREAAAKMLLLAAPQQELLAVLRTMEEQGLKVISLDDKSADGPTPLAEIDPFTFLATFNRGIAEENRKANWRFLKQRWNLAANVPDDFSGIPVVLPLKAWFFPYLRKREQGHIDALWQIFRQAAVKSVAAIDPALFDRCVELQQITTNKLTIGLFWVNPDHYLPADNKTKSFVESKGVLTKPSDYASYCKWLDEVRDKVGADFPNLSHDAHVWATNVSDDEGSDSDDGEAPKTRRVWLVAPGSKASEWETFYKDGIVGIGWDSLKDLRKYKNKAAIQKKLQEVEEDSSKVNDTLACWQFAHAMEPGDILFAKKGVRKIVGYGILEGEYEYDESRGWYKHVRRVKWLASGDWDVPEEHHLPTKTLTDISDYHELIATLNDLLGIDPDELGDSARPPKKPDPDRVAYWWLNANPKQWSFEQAPVGSTQTYTSHNENGNKRQKYKYFHEVKPGDLLVGYVTSPQREIVGICEITKGLHDSPQGEQIEFRKIERLTTPILYETLKASPDLEGCEPLAMHQGSLFKLTESEYEVIRSLIDEANPAGRPAPRPYTKQMAMNGLFLSEQQFDAALDALDDKKNLLLQGPPGVGKTFVARRIAKALVGSDDDQRIEMVQFHQSYSYEDFIQGFRPTAKGTFELRNGLFHQFCRRAQRDESNGLKYVFIIDEINRGNLSKVFGELMMLLEADKRGRGFAIPLAYAADSDDKFYIPDNLYLIGTMNTADRSLALVDYALRRRFRFMTLRPEFLSQSFEQHLQACGASPELRKMIIERIGALNKAIATDTKNLGSGYEIGHSYFCPRNGAKADIDWYRRVVESEIVPLIQEYWFDDEKKVAEQRKALLS